MKCEGIFVWAKGIGDWATFSGVGSEISDVKNFSTHSRTHRYTDTQT